MTDMNKDGYYDRDDIEVFAEETDRKSVWEHENSKWESISEAIGWSVLSICVAAVLITGMLTGVIS